jgi:hypothetical protein
MFYGNLRTKKISTKGVVMKLMRLTYYRITIPKRALSTKIGSDWEKKLKKKETLTDGSVRGTKVTTSPITGTYRKIMTAEGLIIELIKS